MAKKNNPKKAPVKTRVQTSGVTSGMIVGAAATAAAAAAAAYWFYGAKDAAKHRKTARSFMLKARAETMDAVEAAVAKLGDIDKDTYVKIVDDVVKRYSNMAGVSPAEVAQMTKDLKAAWSHMQAASKSAKNAGKKIVKKAKKTSKKKR